MTNLLISSLFVRHPSVVEDDWHFKRGPLVDNANNHQGCVASCIAPNGVHILAGTA
jgi:endoglucanase Acf2